MYKGTVALWNDARGFGFIRREDGSPDIFCHYTGINSDEDRKTLYPGKTVSFDVEMGPKEKPQACNVKVEV